MDNKLKESIPSKAILHNTQQFVNYLNVFDK